MTSKLKQLKECPETVSEDLSPKTDPDDSSEVSNFDENENEQVSKKEFGKDTGENEPRGQQGAPGISKEQQANQSPDNEQQATAYCNKCQQGAPGISNEHLANESTSNTQLVNAGRNRGLQGAPEISNEQQTNADSNMGQQDSPGNSNEHLTNQIIDNQFQANEKNSGQHGAPGISDGQQANQSTDNEFQDNSDSNRGQLGSPGISNEQHANESTSNTQLVNAGRSRGLQGAPEISNEQQTNADSNMGQQGSPGNSKEQQANQSADNEQQANADSIRGQYGAPGNSNEHLTNQIIDNQSQANEKNSGQHGAPGISDGQQTNQSTDNEFQVADSNRGQQGSPGISNEQQDNQGTNFDEQADPCNNTHQGNSATARDEALRRSARVTDEELAKKFRLVQDERNYKASSTGGKGFGPYGQIFEETTVMTRRINKIPNYKGDKWRYVVAMNCKRGSTPVENVLNKIDQLISEGNRNRLAFVLGINEKVTMEQPLSYQPTWEDLLTEDEENVLTALNIPILLVYFQWTSFREVKNQILNAFQVREQMFEDAKLHPKILGKWVEEDRKADHQFPMGTARKFLLDSEETLKLISNFAGGKIPVYIHVQDSDVVSYQEALMFTDFQSEEVAPLIPALARCLLDRYDILIELKRSQNGFLPVFVGGAHVYSPNEDLSKLGITSDDAAKNFTRLGAEMSNFIR